jgi:site-specific recombinase XerD
MFRYKGKTLKYSTGESINPKYWNSNSQRAKETSKFPEYPDLNHFLNKLGERTLNIFRNYKSEGIMPEPNQLRQDLKDSYKENNSNGNFSVVFDEFIEAKKSVFSKGTIKNYQIIMRKLNEYAGIHKMKLSFDKLDLKFFEKYINHLFNIDKMVDNSVTRHVKTLKSFLNWASEHGYNSCTEFKKVKANYSEADTIALTYKELMDVLNLDLTKDTSMEKVRDVFCFGCFTGLRYSDISQLKKDNIRGEEIHLSILKTKDSIVIPLNKFALQILKKYDYSLPVFSNSMANLFIKQIGKLAGINEKIIRTRHRGSEMVQDTQPKYQFLSSHTGRRTFVTLSLELGMRPEVVMSVTGHKGYNSFKRYIKLTSKTKMQEMQQVWNK